ncbi:MAG: hypothetical protein CPSOU_5153 [uncultured Paraburkholderia sp.]|nr:MAG: hypothetical protein CPSOU_5153 [uncultured Paraburkholderia sp.]
MYGIWRRKVWPRGKKAPRNGPALVQKRALKPGQSAGEKNPNKWFGFNPPKEEVEETVEVAHCCNRWSDYMKHPCAMQEHLHCEIAFYNVGFADASAGMPAATPAGQRFPTPDVDRLRSTLK